MIDTIKFTIKDLSDAFVQELKEYLLYSKKENVLRDVLIEFYNHSENIGSYNSNISFFFCPVRKKLDIELSLPKYWQGHNVYMLYPHNIDLALYSLHNALSQILSGFPPLSSWLVTRLDICYNFVFLSDEVLRSYLSVLRSIDYPRHKKFLYSTSLMSVGTSYAIKFYDKGSEFYKHDFPKLVKTKPDLAHYMRLISASMLRFEVSLRYRYIKTNFNHLIASDLSTINYDDLLNKFLSKFLRYNTAMTTNSSEALKKLLNKYDSAKAIKLYTYWQVKNIDTSENLSTITNILNRATIYRYNKYLRDANIGILSNAQLPTLSIPSIYKSN